MHLDDAVYADAHTFDPFRFARMHEAEGDAEGTKYQYASTSPDYLAFGHGRHGWCVPSSSRRSRFSRIEQAH